MNKPLYGLMAEFTEPEQVLSAMKLIHSAGFRSVDAYSPFPIDELAEVMEQDSHSISLITFICAIMGILSGYALQYYSLAMAYPMNIGGRPLNSWPLFFPICFELMILFAGIGAVLAMFLMNHLPKPYHPVFNVPEFNLMSSHRFFIVIEKKDPLFHLETTKDFLQTLNAQKIIEVEE